MIDEALTNFAMNLDEATKLVEDLDGPALVAQPRGAPCHAAWTLGHLTYACQAIGEELSIPHWLADDWRRLFAPGSRPVADLGAYPRKAELLAALADGRARVVAAVRAMGEEGMRLPLPDVRWRAVLPTIGHAVVYSCCGHSGRHAGMLAVWRGAAGLPSSASTG